MATRNLICNDHFGEDKPATRRVAPPILAELSESEQNRLLRVERAQLVEKLEKSLKETNRYKDELTHRNTHGTEDQLKKKYEEVEELYDQQACDQKEIKSLRFQCKEGERMICNLRGTVNTLMEEAERVRHRRREELQTLGREYKQWLPQQSRNLNSVPRQAGTFPRDLGTSAPIPVQVFRGFEPVAGYNYSVSPVSVTCYICSQPQRMEDLQDHYTRCEMQRQQARAEELADLFGSNTQPFSLRTE